MFSLSITGRGACIQTFAKVVSSFVDRCLQQVIPDLLQCTLAPEWSWAVGEVCEMPEALHPTHDSRVS